MNRVTSCGGEDKEMNYCRRELLEALSQTKYKYGSGPCNHGPDPE